MSVSIDTLMRSRAGLGLGLALGLALALPAVAVDTADTRLLSEPAVSAERIAFAYANDLWTAKPDGSGVARLTSHPGVESGPRFSPDGAWIAFTGRYEGNTDVYVVSAAGGVPRRLTYHPGNDTALGFTPDGKSVLFASPREVHTLRYQQLFTVPVEGGFPTKLPIPNASKAAISPDGKTIAYLPLYEAFNQWKNYRGGTTARLLLFDTKTYDVVQVPQPEGRCNDTDPMWLDGALWFRSDRDGEFNLYRYEPATKAVTRVTRHEDFPVLTASAGAGSLVYEQAGALHRLDPKSGTASRLKVGVATDLVEHRPRWAKGAKWVRGGHISPTGARVALEFRGEIVTLPREKGDERNLTQTPGVHEQSPSWSPDGRAIAYFSDQSGEYQLVIAPQDGKGTRRSLPLSGSGFYYDIRWSPDAKKLSYTDNSRAIWMLDVTSGVSTKISADKIYGPNGLEALDHAWSPDSQWLAFTRNNEVFFNRIFLYSLATKQEIAVTDGLSDARRPVWDASGKYLFFKASTDAGPVVDWFSQANADMEINEQLYLAVLAKGVTSPLAKESDEEKPKEDKPAETAKSATDKAKAGDKPAEKKDEPVKVTVDEDGLALRILALPAKAGRYGDLTAGPAGQIFYRRGSFEGRVPGGDAALLRYDLGKRKEDTLLEKADGFQLSADGKRALVRVKESWSLVDIADKLDLAKFKLDVDKVQVRVEPLAEWTQIYDEAWRVNRDYFYDPGMHGADWKALKTKYAAFLPHLATRNDLQRVMTWLHSELAVGHHRQSPGDTPWELENVPGGLLGADYAVENGRYRFKKVFGGLNWNPDLRAPLTEPGVDVKQGEYLLAVEGRDLKFPDEIYARFERTAGKSVEITVGPNPDGTGSRTVKVVPIDNEANLRNRDWVEGNLAKVTAATNGRVAYVYVPNTAGPGHTYFKRYFFPQSNREALIIDERHNGGGQVADYYIDLMRRPRLSYWAFRYGADLKTPIAGIHGPKVMLADETAGSGGDMLPWMFQQLKLGKVVGKRTWGGLVGVLGFPTLMDGAVMTAPNLAIWTEDGFIVENVGVPPDVEVEQTPKDVIAGRDPQLEKAIEIALAELKANPVVTPKRPPFPVRVRKP
ncbi:MAG: PDZ domain-containing protein [Vicinamibacteria bacterium]|nr:PDZ domain-containing protein [Vicinamibacteria bacterium]